DHELPYDEHLLKLIVSVVDVSSPQQPTMHSLPAMYCCTSTSSNCSVMAAMRALSPLRSLTTDWRSRPALASSAAGLTMAGSGKSSSIFPCATVQRGTGRPARSRSVLATALRRHVAVVHGPEPV